MTRISCLLAFASLWLLSGVAFAQQPATTPPPAMTPAPAAQAPEPGPAPAPAPAPASDPMLAPPAETYPPEPKPVEAMPLPEEAVEQTEEAAEESPAPSITGFVETAYHLLASDPDGQGSTAVPLRSYDGMARNSFLLHAAHLAVAHSFNDQVSATMEIDAGSDAIISSYAYGSSLFDLQEAYLTYKPSEFSLTAGKFVTYAGIEVIEGPLNPTLTRGFLFGMAEAFTHVGVKAHYTTDMFDVGVGVINGWDQIVDDNGAKMLMFKIGATPSDMFMISGSGYISIGSDEGDADRGLNSFDITGSISPSESFALWFQGNFGMQKAPVGDEDASWFGLGVQPVYTADAFSFGGRIEWFNDADGARTFLGADKASVLNITLTPGYTLAEAFTLRFEYRMDVVLSGEVGGVDTKDLLVGPGGAESMQHSLGLGAHYVFN
jgi:hypothetical protein